MSRDICIQIVKGISPTVHNSHCPKKRIQLQLLGKNSCHTNLQLKNMAYVGNCKFVFNRTSDNIVLVTWWPPVKLILVTYSIDTIVKTTWEKTKSMWRIGKGSRNSNIRL